MLEKNMVPGFLSNAQSHSTGPDVVYVTATADDFPNYASRLWHAPLVAFDGGFEANIVTRH